MIKANAVKVDGQLCSSVDFFLKKKEFVLKVGRKMKKVIVTNFDSPQ
jgi:hypothetical protein